MYFLCPLILTALALHASVGVARPTKRPFPSPTKKPSSAIPTGVPSRVPTGIPSARPSQTTSPEFLSTYEPSCPSSLPSMGYAQPSTLLSQPPSSDPSEEPSVEPSENPSSQPSLHPSQPTTRSPFPTAHPSVTTPALPSAQPAVVQTQTPTNPLPEEPTYYPSPQPTRAPFESPTGQPTTLQPTSTPSFRSTRRPKTRSPTRQPSWLPTTTPSLNPSSQPSVEPSFLPTFTHPTLLPSTRPSAAPSKVPSEAYPSCRPSGQPSSYPSYSKRKNTIISVAQTIAFPVSSNMSVFREVFSEVSSAFLGVTVFRITNLKFSNQLPRSTALKEEVVEATYLVAYEDGVLVNARDVTDALNGVRDGVSFPEALRRALSSALEVFIGPIDVGPARAFVLSDVPSFAPSKIVKLDQVQASSSKTTVSITAVLLMTCILGSLFVICVASILVYRWLVRSRDVHMYDDADDEYRRRYALNFKREPQPSIRRMSNRSALKSSRPRTTTTCVRQASMCDNMSDTQCKEDRVSVRVREPNIVL